MSSFNSLFPDKLARLVGTPRCPLIVDLRSEDDFAADPRLIPGTVRRDAATVAEWATSLAGFPAIAACQRGHKLNHGVAAWLRHAGASADVLDGGVQAWERDRGNPQLAHPEAGGPR